jgi:hypothetical protein
MITKSRRMRRAGHVRRTIKITDSYIFVVNPERKKRQPSPRLKDNIKMNLIRESRLNISGPGQGAMRALETRNEASVHHTLASDEVRGKKNGRDYSV